MSATQLHILPRIPDTRAALRKKTIEDLLGKPVDEVIIADTYTLEGFTPAVITETQGLLTHPVTEEAQQGILQLPTTYDWAIEIGFQPGVTDNVATTVAEMIMHKTQQPLTPEHGVYTSQHTFIRGANLNEEDMKKVAALLANPLIQRIAIRTQTQQEQLQEPHVPRVRLPPTPAVTLVHILEANDDELAIIGKKGIANIDGTRRGPLALDLTYMQAIQAHFQHLGRNPTDIELESLAQTWSEHCHHTIFADPIDNISEGLFRRYITGATKKIRAAKQAREEDFCLSVFTDNSGAIIFDENYLITHKVETHNSPSALDPYGGSITGIVGVNRDTIGFGMGAQPFANVYGFCLGNPHDKRRFYRNKTATGTLEQEILSREAIMTGVINGVNVGGNCSGIPTEQGFMYFDEDYAGKPLVFVGTLGIAPRTLPYKSMDDTHYSWEKQAHAGDYIVMVGGRVGKDGIHGATFSSEAMDAGSPATAVQIGDPITQKKLSDAIIKEARDRRLYTSITDNGAGGLSCSVAEMAKECGGCEVDIDKVPTKYLGLAPWEIWVSESQERMTLAVPPEDYDNFEALMQRRGVEATVIGTFTNSGKVIVKNKGTTIMDLDIAFLHDGLPQRPMTTEPFTVDNPEPPRHDQEDLTPTLYGLLKSSNIASTAFIAEQYDHEVQGGSVLKPLQGKGRVNGDAAIVRPLLHSQRGVVLSQGINPNYGRISTYHMAQAVIDIAVRKALAAGAPLEHLALLDNFCWSSSNDPKRLHQLLQAVRGCHDLAVAYKTPFISGKDSMYNDFKGFDEEGRPVIISAPPTLLISAVGVMRNVEHAVSIDAKQPGDLVYLLGTTQEELGGSAYFRYLAEQAGLAPTHYTGNDVPRITSPEKNYQLYQAYQRCLETEIIASATAVHLGGLGIALARTAMAGKLGMHVDVTNIPGVATTNEDILYSESLGRLVVTIAPNDQETFEQILEGQPYKLLGAVRRHNQLIIQHATQKVVDTTIEIMLEHYRAPFRNY
ncbi:MAG TPA: AIR synthase-related protein [Candidatus Nanoarchaeia archaeon]|nr:AIR synthase-related protein [Candidatus Nanoarchaeia archaeon]